MRSRIEIERECEEEVYETHDSAVIIELLLDIRDKLPTEGERND